MESKTIEATGMSVEEAIEKGLEELGRRKDDVVIEVIEKASAFGSAKVKITTKEYSLDDIKTTAKEIANLLGHDLFVDVLEGEEEIQVKYDGNDVSKVIGAKGTVLNALQTIFTARYSRFFGKPITVEGGEYRERRMEALKSLAEKMAQKALRTKRPVALEYMPSWERRYIHLQLVNNEDVQTESRGKEGRRQVVIIPKGEYDYKMGVDREIEDGETFTGMYSDEGVVKLRTRASKNRSFGK